MRNTWFDAIGKLVHGRVSFRVHRHLTYLDPVFVFQVFTYLRIMGREQEIDMIKPRQVFQKCKRGFRGLFGVGTRIQFVENTEMSNDGQVAMTTCLDRVQYFFASARLGLEKTVAFRRIRNVQIRMQMGIHMRYSSVTVTTAAKLLRKYHIQQRRLQIRRLARCIGSRQQHVSIHPTVVLDRIVAQG